MSLFHGKLSGIEVDSTNDRGIWSERSGTIDFIMDKYPGGNGFTGERDISASASGSSGSGGHAASVFTVGPLNEPPPPFPGIGPDNPASFQPFACKPGGTLCIGGLTPPDGFAGEAGGSPVTLPMPIAVDEPQAVDCRTADG